MSWNSLSQNNKKIRKIIVAITIYSLIICFSVFIFISHRIEQNKYRDMATMAAKEYTPNPDISNLKIYGGFAMAIISDSTVYGPANADNTIVFKVNNDNSMTQIAVSSFFTTINLLELGVPIDTQSKLTGLSLGQIQQDIANDCNYNKDDNIPGYRGFNSSFNPDGWGVDASKLFYIKKALNSVVSNANSGIEPDDKVICINAITDNSDFKLDKNTHNASYIIQLQFITYKGDLKTHKLEFYDAGKNSWVFKLDGKKI